MATNELKTSKVRRLRGSASIREDGTFDFRPEEKGLSARAKLRLAPPEVTFSRPRKYG